MWSPDAYKVPGPLALRHFLIAAGVIGSFSYLLYKTMPDAPMARKVRAASHPRPSRATASRSSWAAHRQRYVARLTQALPHDDA